MVEYLIENGANVNTTNENGYSSLMFATDEGFPDVVELLLDKGADLKIKATGTGYAGWLAIHLLSSLNHENNIRILDILLRHGADINARDGEGTSPLTNSISFGQRKLVELLCQRGADLNMVGGGVLGNSALMQAAFKGKLDRVEILLKYKPLINLLNDYNETALDNALRRLESITEHKGLYPDEQRKILEANLIILLLRAHGAKTATELKGENPAMWWVLPQLREKTKQKKQ
jgi:serine/threonine-protein phosphatase 6 regulatory ankyrin repeat subunit B